LVSQLEKGARARNIFFDNLIGDFVGLKPTKDIFKNNALS